MCALRRPWVRHFFIIVRHRDEVNMTQEVSNACKAAPVPRPKRPASRRSKNADAFLNVAVYNQACRHIQTQPPVQRLGIITVLLRYYIGLLTVMFVNFILIRSDLYANICVELKIVWQDSQTVF